jgi:hypothetical protein
MDDPSARLRTNPQQLNVVRPDRARTVRFARPNHRVAHGPRQRPSVSSSQLCLGLQLAGIGLPVWLWVIVGATVVVAAAYAVLEVVRPAP